MKIKLIAVDLDGTLLTSRKKVSPKTLATLKKAREKSFMEGREYKHVAHDGMPWDNSPCFYNLEEIDRWIERQASARPRRHLT